MTTQVVEETKEKYVRLSNKLYREQNRQRESLLESYEFGNDYGCCGDQGCCSDEGCCGDDGCCTAV